MANNSNPYEDSDSEYQEYEFLDDEEDLCEGEEIRDAPSEMEAEDVRNDHNHSENEEEMGIRQVYLFFFNNLDYSS